MKKEKNMKELKSTRKHICRLVMILILCWMSMFVAFAEEEVIVTEDNIEFDFGESCEDGQVRLYTYTIKDMDGKIAGTVELRYGINTGSKGKLLWITTEQDSVQIDSVHVGRNYLQISKEVWSDFFTEEAYTYEVTEKVLKPIDPVEIEGIRWGEKGVVYVDWNEDSDLKNKTYVFKTYFNDKLTRTINIERSKKEKWTQRWYFSNEINESGSYGISIKVIGTSKTMGDSEEIFAKIPYQYTLPDTKIEEIKEIRCRTKEGEMIPTVMEWDPLAGVTTYEVCLEIWIENRRKYSYSISGVRNVSGTNKPIQYDWSKHNKWSVIKGYATQENVTFVVWVRPLSSDIELIANGEKTIEENYQFYDKIEEIKERFKDTTVETILKDIERTGLESVATAMQMEEDFLKKMEDLEEEYKSVNENIQTNTEVQHSKVSEVKVVGAAMNVVSGGAVTLHFNEVPKEQRKEINRVLYDNDVQIDIKLDGAIRKEIKESGVLLSPITVIMDPPKGIEPSKLIILHYHSDEKPERIYPVFRADGKITFSVTKFSTFVFAEMRSYVEDTSDSKPSKPDNNDDDDDDDDDSEMISILNQGVQTYGIGKKFVKADGSIAKSEWVSQNGKWYYAKADGTLKTGWHQNAAGVWYYLQENCEMAINWQKINGKWYFLDTKNGDMKTNWLQTTDGKWYYLNPKNGDMIEGWQLVNGKWYYFNPISGEMATGWKQVGGKWYFLTKNGDCLLNTVTPDGYQVDKDGAWLP